ncbi:hypothetical protein KSF78_0007844 [Schistosoma japonicum]|nr:hypothetical protein KSF78_0007844 [Schistosoma japonicum]
MIHPDCTFNIVQSVIGQLSSDHSNFNESSTPFFRIDLLLEANINTNCSSVIIGMIIGLLIIFIKNLHTPSSWNTIIIIITMLLLGYAFLALNYSDYWIYVVIRDILIFLTTDVAVILGAVLKVLSVQWRKILFGFACSFILTGIIFTILGFVCQKSDSLRIDFWSIWYLLSRTGPSGYTFIFKLFLIFYEFVVLNTILQIVFVTTGCVR